MIVEGGGSMTVRTARACVFLGLASFAAAQNAPLQRALPHIATPDALAIEMAEALVAGDREQFMALTATREEMEQMLETAQPPATPEARQELNRKWPRSVAAAIGREGP